LVNSPALDISVSFRRLIFNNGEPGLRPEYY
jgi:hypothetical protein